jgi:hypothetical protein
MLPNQNIDSTLEIEAQANGLRARRNELMQALAENPSQEQAKEMTDELAEIEIAIDKLYLSIETMVDAKREAKSGVQL